MLIDAHCHVDPHHFREGADAVLDRARDSGVEAFVVVGVDADLSAARFVVELASRRSDVYAAVGIHPHDASALDEAMLGELEELARRSEVVAVGEIGLDYHYMHSPKDVQQRVFAELIALARRVRKPIVVHTREAAQDTLAILEHEGANDVGGIIHCFSEDRPFAERALALDFDLSFSGIVTFKSARTVQDVAAWAPGDRILLETDSPYLAPIPLRGKRCEPAHVLHTARFVAGLRGESIEALSARTSANTRRRLRLPQPG